MKAMILAAGLGTRLEHHTLERPKALVEVNGKPLLAYVIEKLIASNFRHIVINVHHFAEQIIEYIQRNNFDARIEFSDETNRLLNTGGGILKAKPFLDGDEPFLVHNVDILSDIDLLKLADYHNATNSFATLAVGKRNSSRQFLFDSTMKLAGWRNNSKKCRTALWLCICWNSYFKSRVLPKDPHKRSFFNCRCLPYPLPIRNNIGLRYFQQLCN